MQLTGQKLGNITDSKNSRRVNPSAATRPRRWTEELVQNKQSKTLDLFIPLHRDVSSQPAIFITGYAAFFLAVQLEGGEFSALLQKQEAPAVLFLCFSLMVKSPSRKHRALFYWLNKKKRD